jgi:putative transposase
MEAEVAREAGRLEMIYDEAKRSWYAHIPVEVENCVKVAGNLRASVDLGIINLATVYVEDGSWYVFKGGSVISRYEYYGKRIAVVQKTLTRHKQKRSRNLKLLHNKRRRFLKHALNSMVRKILEGLKEKGVGEVVIGYPKEISKMPCGLIPGLFRLSSLPFGNPCDVFRLSS